MPIKSKSKKIYQKYIFFRVLKIDQPNHIFNVEYYTQNSIVSYNTVIDVDRFYDNSALQEIQFVLMLFPHSKKGATFCVLGSHEEIYSYRQGIYFKLI